MSAALEIRYQEVRTLDGPAHKIYISRRGYTICVDAKTFYQRVKEQLKLQQQREKQSGETSNLSDLYARLEDTVAMEIWIEET